MIIYQTLIKRSDLKANPKLLYVFGDNDVRSGLGGLAAECRGEPNAVGVRTKARPSMDAIAFWRDSDYDKNTAKIDADLERVIGHLRRGGIIVMPLNGGIGQASSKMPEKCPRTFEYLQRRLDSLKAI